MENKKRMPAWFSDLSKFSVSHNGKALWQLFNTIIPYVGLWALMLYLYMSGYSYWIVFLLSIPAGGFMVRTFILFHDCCHGSFFSSRKANRFVGYVTGILTFTAFDEWRRLHNIHHATSGDLERRGTGDVWTMTLSEYKNAGKGKRFIYRMFRNPLILFGFGPFYLFLISNRVTESGAKKAEKLSVWLTNFSILAIVLTISWLFSFKAYLLIQLPIMFFAGAMGIWLFYVQHQFEDAYWSQSEEWSILDSAIQGSSFYKLPLILQWISGNIGFHHIHHLKPRIPNYNLEKCNNSIPALKEIQPLTFFKSLKSLRLHLWDEVNQRLVGYKAVKL